jgi:bifunctional non-homologous end joining protein LigD
VSRKPSPAKAKPHAGRLKTYGEKRDFTRTSEPEPKLGKNTGWQFVVQKHDARRLHFDLRLELDGVLKSWAVTRGPSLMPGEKRLAVQTEDHPMEYLDWEGVIPKGEYGGGTMIVWDRGIWKPEADPHRGLQKGHLDFSLEGSRLKGRWHLVRMSRKSGEKKDPWLLIKSKDEYARKAGEPEIVDEEMTSYLTGRSNDELAAEGDIRADHASRAKVVKTALPNPSRLKGAKKGILPVFVAPSLAVATRIPPADNRWVHEIKHNGYRIQARIDGGKVKLLTRTGLDWTVRFRPIESTLKKLPVGSALLDGEIVVQDENGISSFAGLQADLKSGRKDRLAYFVFDLLYLEGVDIRAVRLRERKALLKAVIEMLPPPAIVQYSDHMEEDGKTVLDHACRMGLEGIISKRVDLPYCSGRGEHWVKSKCVLREEFVIVGYVPSTAMDNAVGSLVLAYYDKDQLIYAGRAGTGFSEDQAAELCLKLEQIRADKPQFAVPLPPGVDKGVRWVSPELVSEIEFRGWSSDRLLFQAAFKGLREDKTAEEAVLEEHPAEIPAKPARSIASYRLTHPERLLWEAEGITKQGLAEFYADIADWILPHVQQRVLSLVRCPSGMRKPCFYAKHAWQGVSKAILRVDVGEDGPMLAIEDLEGLIALVQAGVLEIHPWGSRSERLEQPDRIIFDLDPGEEVPWSKVIAAALEVRERLERMGLQSFVKTSGGKGLHVMLPIVPEAGWDKVKAFTQTVAEAMATDSPNLYVDKMTKSLRRGRVFVDYLRNGRGATAVAAYSTRARANAPVSTPLAWDELSEAIKADHFTLDNLRQRLAFIGHDPWADYFRLKQKLRLRNGRHSR